MPINKAYGCRPDLADQRDHVCTVSAPTSKLPLMMDLQPGMPPIRDQNSLGACTGFGTAAVYEFELMRQHLSDFTPSPLFIYYNERQLEGTTSLDSGAEIRDGIKAIARWGAAPEAAWPYRIDQFATAPPAEAYAAAAPHTAVLYERVPQTLRSMMGVLASGLPIVFGMTVYESFESDEVARTGMVPLPAPEEKVVGGHCCVVAGYRTDWRTFKVRNSWGADWGRQGYCHIPFEYLLNNDLASDFWVVRIVK